MSLILIIEEISMLICSKLISGRLLLCRYEDGDLYWKSEYEKGNAEIYETTLAETKSSGVTKFG